METERRKRWLESTVEHRAYASPYKCGTRKCNSCLTEKIIARSDPKK